MDFTRNGFGLRVWRAVTSEKHWKDSYLSYYGSSIPFCPRAYWLSKHVSVPRLSSYQNDVTLRRGSAIHEAVQEWLGETGLLYGNWRCPTCAAAGSSPYRIEKRLGPPESCPTHFSRLRYEEFKLSYHGLIGRPDGLLADRGGYALLEIKTIHADGWDALTAPLTKHVEQANAYACMVPPTLGLNITRVTVWYFSGDRPQWDPKIWEFQPNPARFEKHLQRMAEIEALPLDGAPPPCTEHDPYCPLAPYCDASDNAILKLIQTQS